MPTTRKRVNLTLTEMEERFLDAITTAGTAEGDAFARYLAGDTAGADVTGPLPSLADAVHVVLRLGINGLESEMAELSYAAEAMAHAPQDRVVSDALRHSLYASLGPGRE